MSRLSNPFRKCKDNCATELNVKEAGEIHTAASIGTKQSSEKRNRLSSVKNEKKKFSTEQFLQLIQQTTKICPSASSVCLYVSVCVVGMHLINRELLSGFS
jgi:hypothetical protein